MFGKPQWYRPGKRPGAVRPVNWAGWLHTGAWASALAVPAVLLLNLHRGPEALVWLAAMSLGWWLDLRPIRAVHNRQDARPDVFVIDDQTDITRLATGKFDFLWKRQ